MSVSSANMGNERTAHDASQLVPEQDGTTETDHENIISSVARDARQALSQLGMGGVIDEQDAELHKTVVGELQRNRRHTLASLTATVLGVLVAMVNGQRSHR